MSRMLRAFVAVFAVVGLVGPLLGACLCAGTVAAADPHACCPAPAGPRLSESHACCTDDAREDSGATVSPTKALIDPGPAVAAAAIDVPHGAPSVRPHSLHLPTRPLVLRI